MHIIIYMYFCSTITKLIKCCVALDVVKRPIIYQVIYVYLYVLLEKFIDIRIHVIIFELLHKYFILISFFVMMLPAVEIHHFIH